MSHHSNLKSHQITTVKELSKGLVELIRESLDKWGVARRRQLRLSDLPPSLVRDVCHGEGNRIACGLEDGWKHEIRTIRQRIPR